MCVLVFVCVLYTYICAYSSHIYVLYAIAIIEKRKGGKEKRKCSTCRRKKFRASRFHTLLSSCAMYGFTVLVNCYNVHLYTFASSSSSLYRDCFHYAILLYSNCNAYITSIKYIRVRSSPFSLSLSFCLSLSFSSYLS